MPLHSQQGVYNKSCPAQWANQNSSGWNAFNERVKAILNGTNDWQTTYLNTLVSNGIITDKVLWSQYDAPVTKAQAIALINKATRGTWGSDEANLDFHWAQPMVVSLCGKGIISDKNQWINNLDISISKALLLALVDKATNGTMPIYAERTADHWGRNCLDSLCDKAIISTPFDYGCRICRTATIRQRTN